MDTLPKTYKQNSIFRGGPRSYLNACVGRNGGFRTAYDYAQGYYSAAELLADYARGRSANLDALIYPIVYLYRHGIELGFKSLVELLPFLWHESPKVAQTHKIIDNWIIVKSYLVRSRDFDKDKSLIPTVESILNDLVEIDPTGETFRFAQSRRGEQHLEDTSLINLEVFTEAMEYVRDALYFWHNVRSEIRPELPLTVKVDLNVEIIYRVIDLAKEVYEMKHSAVSSSAFLPSSFMEDEDNPQRQKLIDYLIGLSIEERAQITALMWLGRGHSGERVEEWESLVATALEEEDVLKTTNSIDYIVNKAPLAEYLENGLAQVAEARANGVVVD